MRLRLPAILFFLLPHCAAAWPLDGYPETGIRRLEEFRLANLGEVRGPQQPPGAMLPTAAVDIRLAAHPDVNIPAADPDFSRQIRGLLGENVDRYGIVVLDVSDPGNPRYAEVNGNFRQNIGSVGKIVAALGLFQALADTWPDPRERVNVLRDTIVTADEFAHWDHHTVHLFNVETRARTVRPIRDGDQASLWEYLDWMLSASSNSAAGMVMREAMLIRRFGRDYPLPAADARRYFEETPRTERTELFRQTFYEPMTRSGLDIEEFRQGSFFTAQGKAIVPGPGNSYATPRSLLQFALLMEQGRLVDPFSSREMKRLLYVTERRIRFASSPRLQEAAVYFKSGSLYSCRAEEGFTCGKYMGNVKNYMNSFAIVESPATEPRIHYLVMLVSNVLRRNSAVDHQTLATRIHRLLEEAHAD